MRKCLLFMGLLLMVGSQIVLAQQRYAWCNATNRITSNNYASAIFEVPDGVPLNTFPNGSYGYPEATSKFEEFLGNRVNKGDTFLGCPVYSSRSDAESAKVEWARAWGGAIDDTGWTYAPKITGTATARGIEQKIEAAALYDAEQHAQQAIPFQPGKTFWVKNWDEHSCERHDRKTSQYAGADTVVSYTCTVKFTYSEEKNQHASAALGEGPTRDAAIQTAKLNHLAVRWDKPFCSQTTKHSAYAKPSYKVGETSPGSEWWVCTVGYNSTQ